MYVSISFSDDYNGSDGTLRWGTLVACFYCFCLKSAFNHETPSNKTPLYEAYQLNYHLSPFLQLFRRVIPQRQALQLPPLSMLLEVVMVRLVVLGLQALWRVGSFLWSLLRGVWWTSFEYLLIWAWAIDLVSICTQNLPLDTWDSHIFGECSLNIYCKFSFHTVIFHYLLTHYALSYEFNYARLFHWLENK